MKGAVLQSDIPARLDRLPWSRWHATVVVALGATWLLDGLQVALGGALGAILKTPQSLGLTDVQLGVAGAWAIVGSVTGAVVFGRSTDRWGRKRLFYLTLLLYMLATAASGLSWNFASFVVFRMLAGAGIGGEYAAINSAIDELIPARVRGWVGLAVNATFWLGAVIGAGVVVVLLNPAWVPAWLGWRLTFIAGAVLGLGILAFRRHVPESPRWLMLRGRLEEGEAVVREIEEEISRRHGPLPVPEAPPLEFRPRVATRWREIGRSLLRRHPERSLLGFVLMGSQAFFYASVFFSLPLLLTRFYGIAPERVGLYLVPFALGNVMGPFFLGPLFDRWGRKPMIVATYVLSGLLLAGVGWLFREGAMGATGQVAAFTAVFFVASAAAGSAYVTVSEIFPLEIRALAIAVFYASGTLMGGAAPLLFGALLNTGSRAMVCGGYLFAAGLMAGAAVVEAIWGVAAERRALESVAKPLSQFDD